jgi:hypothetical protein
LYDAGNRLTTGERLKMNKIKITLQIESKKEKRISKLEKLLKSFLLLWKVTLESNLRPNAKAGLLWLIVIALTYLLCRILPLILNHL